MIEQKTFGQKVIEFNKKLSKISMELPDGFKIINPFNGSQKEIVNEISTTFYKRFYNDCNKRRIILGSSPARRGAAVTGVPFEDAEHLQKETGILIDKFYINKSSSGFLYDVIEKYGGCKKFYSDFYMNFVCPVGIVRANSKGNEVNCNYYDSKKLQETLYSLIVSSIQAQIDFGIDTSACYCIGSGDNYTFLSKINKKYNFFDEIIPLEHPRFIMQYNSKHKYEYFEKYLTALRQSHNKDIMDTIRKTIKARIWKDGKEIRPEDQSLPVNQVYAWLFTHDNKIAIVSKDGRKWQLPGGKPNKHETYLQTIVREVAEETGINTDSVFSQYKFFGYYGILETDSLKNDDEYLQLRVSLKLNKNADEYILHQQNEDEEQIWEEQIRYAKFVTVDELTQHIPWASESAELKAAIQSQINFPVSH